MDKSMVKKIIFGVVGFLILITLLSSFRIVDAGERAVVLQWGEITDVKSEGLHFKMPFIEKYKIHNVKTQKLEVAANSASKDLQSVNTTIALNFNLNPDKVDSLWGEVGRAYQVALIDPAIQEAVKSVTANFNAEELITKRSEVREGIKLLLSEKLQSKYFTVTDFAIVDFAFSKSFDAAIEAKVTAEQRALESKNKLEQVKFEAEQQIERARAEAETIKIQAQAITQQGGKDYVQLKAIEKWNGQLPTQFVPNAAVPFITLK